MTSGQPLSSLQADLAVANVIDSESAQAATYVHGAIFQVRERKVFECCFAALRWARRLLAQNFAFQSTEPVLCFVFVFVFYTQQSLVRHWHRDLLFHPTKIYLCVEVINLVSVVGKEPTLFIYKGMNRWSLFCCFRFVILKRQAQQIWFRVNAHGWSIKIWMLTVVSTYEPVLWHWRYNQWCALLARLLIWRQTFSLVHLTCEASSSLLWPSLLSLATKNTKMHSNHVVFVLVEQHIN